MRPHLSRNDAIGWASVSIPTLRRTRRSLGAGVPLDGSGVLSDSALLTTLSLPMGRDPEPVEGIVEWRNQRPPFGLYLAREFAVRVNRHG